LLHALQIIIGDLGYDFRVVVHLSHPFRTASFFPTGSGCTGACQFRWTRETNASKSRLSSSKSCRPDAVSACTCGEAPDPIPPIPNRLSRPDPVGLVWDKSCLLLARWSRVRREPGPTSSRNAARGKALP